MDSKELARWMREEHEKVQELGAKLRERIVTRDRGHKGQWLAEVRENFRKFREHFCRHITLEEEDGYLEAVVEQQPSTAREVEHLKQQHAEMRRVIDSINGCLQEIQPEHDLLTRDCCIRIQFLLSAVDRHEEEENLVVSLVFTRDIGWKD